MINLLHMLHNFLSNPIVTFLLCGFGTWIIFILIAPKIAIKSGEWIDRQLENEQE